MTQNYSAIEYLHRFCLWLSSHRGSRLP